MAIASAGLGTLVGCVAGLVASPSQPPVAVTLSATGTALDDALEAFLEDRIRTTWPSVPREGAEDPTEIAVTLEWGTGDVEVKITRHSEILARPKTRVHA